MPMTALNRIAPVVSALMIASCARSLPHSVSAPRLILPERVLSPCRLDRLPEAPTRADLEASYMARGEALARCDAARALAVQTLLAERTLQDEWLRPDPAVAQPH